MLQWGDSLFRAKFRNGEPGKSRRVQRLSRQDCILHLGDSLLDGRYWRVKYDTTFISRPEERWTVKVRGNLSSAGIEAEGISHEVPFKGEVRSDPRISMSFSLAYRGLTLGFSMNPEKLAGKSKDNEIGLTSYGNRGGFDATLLSSKTYKGYYISSGERTPVDKNVVNQKALNLNAYYVLNSRRFSIPAAFSQNYIQRRSAGSALLGISIDGQLTDINRDEKTEDPEIKVRITEVGIGAGYGYNYVPNRHLLFHLSTIPTFNVFIKSNITIGEEKTQMHYDFPSVIITGRGAAVYSWKNKFVGASMVFNFSTVGDNDRLQIRRDNWKMRLSYGWRF